MKENDIKYLDNLSRKIFDGTSIETPSYNFTDAVMLKVNALQNKKVVVYKPLISKVSWVFIGVGILGLVLYMSYFGGNTETSKSTQLLNFDFISNIKFDVLPSLSISKTFTYTILFFGLMLGVQIPLLKKYFNQRLEN